MAFNDTAARATSLRACCHPDAGRGGMMQGGDQGCLAATSTTPAEPTQRLLHTYQALEKGWEAPDRESSREEPAWLAAQEADGAVGRGAQTPPHAGPEPGRWHCSRQHPRALLG